VRERNELILADLIALRAEQKPELDVLTFEHYSLDGGATADEVRTYAELFANANRIAAWLLARGMQPGDRFVITLRNHPEFVEAMIAASMTGTVFVPVDPRTRADKLAFMVNNSGSRGIVCANYNLAEVRLAESRCPGIEWLLTLDEGVDPAQSAGGRIVPDPIREVLAVDVPTVNMAAVTPASPLHVIYTSGTTGDPKGVVGTTQRFGGTGFMGLVFGYQPDERPYTGLSFTHSNALTTALCPALHSGYRAVFSRKFTKSRLWEICRRYGCTTFSILGGMATAIYSEAPRADDADNPVRLVISGGMPGGLWEAFEKRFGVQLLEIYGASDGGGLAFKPPGVGPVGSFGKPMQGYEMKILDDAGNECPPGVPGEICCRPAAGSSASVDDGIPRQSRGLEAEDPRRLESQRRRRPQRRRGLALFRLPQGRRHPAQRRFHQHGFRREDHCRECAGRRCLRLRRARALGRAGREGRGGRGGRARARRRSIRPRCSPTAAPGWSRTSCRPICRWSTKSRRPPRKSRRNASCWRRSVATARAFTRCADAHPA
jgi:crotonobetaine/carnitine-CoA ligase